MNKGRNIFWGVLFLLGALALLAGKMGLFEGFNLWTILVSIGLIGLFIDGIWHRSYGMTLFSLAFLIIVNDKLLGAEAITPWPVLGAALLGTIGLHILFPDRRWKHQSCYSGNGSSKWNGKHGYAAGGAVKEDRITDDGEVWIGNSLGESVKYLTQNEISQVHLKNSFGTLIVYFENAVLKDGAVQVSVDNSFGSTVLYVPGDWRVVLNVEAAFGDAQEKGCCNPEGSNTVQISGKVSFGELEVRYL